MTAQVPIVLRLQKKAIYSIHFISLYFICLQTRWFLNLTTPAFLIFNGGTILAAKPS